MSNKGIYTALSGAIAQAKRLDTIANNLANVNTTGFKKDKQVFNEYLTANEQYPETLQVPRVTASIESFYDMQAGDRGYVDSKGSYTDFSQGPLKSTGNQFDVAVEGKGFFEILTPEGVKYSRNGSFKVDSQGRLVTKQGFPVLREGLGQNPESRTIQLETKNITISYDGDVYDGGANVGRLGLVDFVNPDLLQKSGNSLYSLKNGADDQIVIANESKIQQGFLEASNVNVIDEMTDMIAASRIFESTQKAIKAFDEMNGKLVNEVPRTR